MTVPPENDAGPDSHAASRSRRGAVAEAADEQRTTARGTFQRALLLVGHNPGRPAREALALAAAAGLQGVTVRGAAGEMLPASVAAVAREAALTRAATRAAVQALADAGDVRLVVGGVGRPIAVAVDATAFAARWTDFRTRVRLPAGLRALELGAATLLLVGLVLASLDEFGVARLGRRALRERSGLSDAAVRRALRDAVAAGALRRWTHRNRIHLCPGSALRASTISTDTEGGAKSSRSTAWDLLESAPPTCSIPAQILAESAPPTCSIPHPDIRTFSETGSPSEAAAGETIEPQRQNQTAPAARRQSPGADDVRGAAGRWAADMAARGIETLTADHAADVARLLDKLGPLPVDVRDPARLAADRLKAGARIAAWARSPERLARWVAVAARRYGPRNVAGYLRRAADRGDPGALLERHAGGAGALLELHEAAMQGDRSADVAELVDAIVEPPRAAVEPAPTTAARPPQAFDERARRVVVARAFGDRHPLARIADELGVAVGVVEAIVADERARRAEDAAGAPAPRRSAPARLGLARSLAATRAS